MMHGHETTEQLQTAENDATVTRVEMQLGWALEDEQKAYLREALSVRPGASAPSLARLIVQPPR